MTVAVAVSGGMDSLFALALLKERGEDLLAVHGHFLPPSPAWGQVADGLARACEALGVPFHALDLHEAFDDRVIKPFVAEYKGGLTPNPCAMCNPRMKFGVLFDAARNLGADRLATGHYVSMADREPGLMLVRGEDASKDQSYFLSMVPVEKLRLAEFPLARTFKRDVPAFLEAHGLTPPLPSESQEICFVPDDDYQRFLTARRDMSGPGPAALPDGRIIGEHQGVWRHTQGQRRGLGIPWSEPLYVLDKVVATNTLVVGPKKFLAAKGCVAGQVNLMCPAESWPETVLVQTRYRQKAKPAETWLSGGKLYFDFQEPHVRPTPGQVAAVYDEAGTVLGGGIIEEAL